MNFGRIILFGSGETSPAGGRVFERLAGDYDKGFHVSVLETPAGFETNSAQVAGRVADFLRDRLKHKSPRVQVIPARRKGSEFGTDSRAILEPLITADWIFLGPGSPTYAVRQLQGSLAWEYILAGWQEGAALLLASAAAIAIGSQVLPVYEIFKAGEDPDWKPGLDLFGPLGLRVIVVPHWNNTEGGKDVDTRRAFIGLERFTRLQSLLPANSCVLGIDEYTTVSIDLNTDLLRVDGAGSATVICGGRESQWASGKEFALTELGGCRFPSGPFGVSAEVWEEIRRKRQSAFTDEPPFEAADLLRERELARMAKDYVRADVIRGKIEALGWSIADTPQGSRLVRKK